MPQPEILGPYVSSLVEAYRASWHRVVEEQIALALDPTRAVRRARLSEIRRSIEAEMRTLDETAAGWIQREFPRIYAAGGAGAVSQLPGAAPFTWTAPHREAVQRLADGLYTDLLRATDNVNQSTKILVRSIARDRLLAKAIEGKTARQAGAEMARLLADRGVYGMIYSNGARHGLASYSEMAIRTVTATAYNQGTLNASEERDVEYWEVFDGVGCGWEYHGSPMEANGRVVTRDQADEYPISHPNCRRSFGPRPDITSKKAAKSATKTATDAQDRAQLDMQLARGEKVVLNRADAKRLNALDLQGVTVR